MIKEILLFLLMIVLLAVWSYWRVTGVISDEDSFE